MARPSIPEGVRNLADRLLPDTNSRADQVHLVQSGRLRRSVSGRWMSFRASHSISTRTCEFAWQAQTGFGRLILVSDVLRDGVGEGVVSFFGVFVIARSRASSELNRGQLIRYLAEIPWAPAAILENPYLRWSELSDNILVSTRDDNEGAAVEMKLDANGRVREVFAARRPRATSSGFIDTPWRGRFFDYRNYDGFWIPCRGEVGWEIGGHESVVWEGQLEKWHTR